MIEEGQYKIMGGNHILYLWLAKSKKNIGDRLLPADLEQSVKGLLGWYNAKLATPGQ